MAALNRISITAYTTKYTAYPADLLAFCETMKVMPPNITSLRGQALALMAQPEVRGQLYLQREDTEQFFEQIGVPTNDAIQQFNKATGLKRIKKRGAYCLVYPYEADTTDLDKRKGVAISGDRNTAIEHIKSWWRTNLVDVPNSEWQVGHLDPTVGDASETNLAYQPPLQAKYRNRFKWNAYFQKMWPTADEWIGKMNKYHTEAEQRAMLAALKAKFE
jgi:hypothetical protein